MNKDCISVCVFYQCAHMASHILCRHQNTREKVKLEGEMAIRIE